MCDFSPPQVIENGLKPAQAILLANASSSSVEIRDYDLSRALAPCIERDAADWHKAEIALREQAEKDGLEASAIAALTTDVHGHSVPKSFIATHPHSHNYLDFGI